MGRLRHGLLGVAAALALLPAGAQARDFNCDASALRVQVGSDTIVEPVTANRGGTTCKADHGVTSLAVGPVVGGAVVAETTVPGVTEAQARGGLASLTVGLSALAGVPLPTLDAIDQIPPTTVPIPLAGQLLNLPPSVTVDIRPAVKALVTGLTSAPLLDVQGSMATANARCVNSQPQLSGQTQIASIKVLGQELPTDAAVQQALNLFDGQTINPGALDLSKIVLPPALTFTDPLVGAILQGAVQDALKALPPITLPATPVGISITPSSQTIADGGITQRGLRVALSVLGQNVVAAIIGEARISVDSVTCVVKTGAGEVAPLESVPKEALSCESRRLALLDVLDQGRYVSLLGAADLRLAGKRIAIRSLADGKVVAHAIVHKNGLFRA